MMKKIIIALLLILPFVAKSQTNDTTKYIWYKYQYGWRMPRIWADSFLTVGTSKAHASSIVDINSTTKGFLIPRMTATQRLAISSPALGLMVFDTDSSRTFQYTSTGWLNVGSGSGGAADGNNYPTGITFNAVSKVLAIQRTGLADISATIPLATTSANGLMDSTSKKRLDSNTFYKNGSTSGFKIMYGINDTLFWKNAVAKWGMTLDSLTTGEIGYKIDSSTLKTWILTFASGGSTTISQALANGRTLPTNDSIGLTGKYFKFYGNTSNVQTEGVIIGKRQFDNSTNAGWYPLMIEPMSTDTKAPNWYWKLNQTVQTGTYPNNVMKIGWNPDLVQSNKMGLWDAFESYYSPGGGTDSILERHFSIQGPGFGEVRLGSWTAYIRNGVLGENNTTNLYSNFDLRAEAFNIYTTTNRTYAAFSQNKTSRVSSFQLQSGNGTTFNLQVDSLQGLISFSQSGNPTPRVVDFFRDGNTRDVNMYGLKISTLFGTQFEGYAGPDADSTREFGGYSTKFKRGYFGTVGSAKQIVGHLAAWGNFTPSSEIINWTVYANDANNFLKMYGAGGSGTKLTIQNNGAISTSTKSGYLSSFDLSEVNSDTLLWASWGQVLRKLAAVGGTTLYTGDGSVSGNRTVTLGTNTFTFSSNSLNKFHIASNGKVSIGSTTNNGYDFNVNGQMGVTGSGYDFAINGASSMYWGTTGDNNVRWIGNGKEFRQIISGSAISFSPYTDNTLPYQIKDFGGTTRFEVDFATPKVSITAGFKLTLGSDASYDTYYRNSSGDFQRLPNGTTGQVLTATTGSAPSWAAPAPSIYPWDVAGVDSANTSNATNTTVNTLTIPDASRGIIEVRMSCIGTDDGTKGLTGIKRVRYKKTGGTLTLGTVETEMAIEYDGGLTTATFTITTSSNNIIIQVTGEAATNLKWKPTYLLTNNAIAL